MISKIKAIYGGYRMIWDNKLMAAIDNFIVSFAFYMLHFINVLSLHGRGALENYIVKKGYSRLNQFERLFSDEALYNMALTIHSTIGWGWTDVYNHFAELSEGTVFLSKRQCYKILDKARCIYNEQKKPDRFPRKSR